MTPLRWAWGTVTWLAGDAAYTARWYLRAAHLYPGVNESFDGPELDRAARVDTT